MTNLPEALETISKALAVLTHQTRAENLSGMFSKNRLTENVLLPVLQILLKAPDLRNTNRKPNFPDIDLASEKTHIAIQVTTERTATKITGTLNSFLKREQHKRYRRLIFFVLTGNKISYSADTKKRWARICGRKLRFDPGSDVVTTLDLLSLVQALPQKEIYEVRNIIAQSVIGESYIDIASFLNRLSRRQLVYEKTSAKYIPDVFVETRETKDLLRCFTHPVLFSCRTFESLRRIPFQPFNRFLKDIGLPPVEIRKLPSSIARDNIDSVSANVLASLQPLREVNDVLSKFRNAADQDGPLPFPRNQARDYYYRENKFTLYSFASGLNRSLEKVLNELAVVNARIFILTGRAGQGKTNLVCDFVENFLLKHDVPCAYLSGRVVRSSERINLGETIHQLLFQGKTASIQEAAHMLSRHSTGIDKPFVLIIDGLNEHHQIREFSEQLEALIEMLMEYPHLKLLLTCRSEFFQQRFGNLTTGALKRYGFLWTANERRLDQESHEELLEGYFSFFEVDSKLISDQVVSSLKRDFLLLRFFCEAYGRRGKPADYRQSFIPHIYREEIFRIYLEQKLGTADLFLQRISGKVKAVDNQRELRNVLEHCVRYMLEQWQFVNVPVSAIPETLNDALYVLLDEELILRRDAPPGTSIFSPSQETVNFTFDEFRDFLLAQYLIHLFESNRNLFEQYVVQSDPKESQIIEGLKRFLFYASRSDRNESFWQHYRLQNWYMDVYDDEVFNIDQRLLRDEDRNIALDALAAGAERGRFFARQLALRWHRTVDPVLNLNLLLGFVTTQTDSSFDELIAKNFKSSPYFHDPLSAAAFCKFISENILQRITPAQGMPEEDLFRFLILLLPVDSDINLNSPAYLLWRKVLETHTEYGVSLLKESLKYKPARHRPYAWRLLSVLSEEKWSDHELRIHAEKDVQSSTPDSVLTREAKRFLDRPAER